MAAWQNFLQKAGQLVKPGDGTEQARAIKRIICPVQLFGRFSEVQPHINTAGIQYIIERLHVLQF